MRVPFPIRVLLSYLLVVLVGALPTFVYLKGIFQHHLVVHHAQQTTQRGKKLAEYLAPLGMHARLDELRRISNAFTERITYIDRSGKVRFDSNYRGRRSFENHAGRVEVRQAWGEVKTVGRGLPRNKLAGYARRFSATTKREMLYVAIPLSFKQQRGDLLRLSVPISRLDSLVSSVLAVFRNSQAAAISIALVLSLIAAVVFMRPLQRTAGLARALAVGDYSATLEKFGNDEIGDVGRALVQLSQEMRRRLALAEASEALLFQLVKMVNIPLAIFGPEERIVALNVGVRELFDSQREDPQEILGRWIASEEYAETLAAAEELGGPQKVEVMFDESVEARVVRGYLEVLKHPSGATFGVFLGEGGVRQFASALPPSSEVTAVPCADVILGGIHRAEACFKKAGVDFNAPAHIPEVSLAEVNDRLGTAVSLLLEGAVMGGIPRSESFGLQVEEEKLFVVLSLDTRVPAHTRTMIKLLVEPLGGAFVMEGGECQVSLPKA